MLRPASCAAGLRVWQVGEGEGAVVAWRAPPAPASHDTGLPGPPGLPAALPPGCQAVGALPPLSTTAAARPPAPDGGCAATFNPPPPPVYWASRGAAPRSSVQDVGGGGFLGLPPVRCWGSRCPCRAPVPEAAGVFWLSSEVLPAAMFVLVEMTDTVRIPPWQFERKLNESIAEELNKKLANKVKRGPCVVWCRHHNIPEHFFLLSVPDKVCG